MSNKSKDISSEFHCGMNFGFASPRGWYGSTKGLAQIEKMKALNINWVAAHVTVVQEAYYSSRIYQDFEHTPADEEISTWVKAAQEAGIKVMLKPIVEPLDGTWRGIIVPPADAGVFGSERPNYRSKWTASLKRMLVHYASIAEKCGVDMFCLGSEYHRVQGWNKEWLEVLSLVREQYTGPVINEFVPHDLHERKLYESIGEWWQELDYLGYSVYPSSDKMDPSVDDFVIAMEKERQVVVDLHKTFGLPIVLAETGCRSAASAGASAAGYTAESNFDGEVQARYAEALMQVFGAEPSCRGLYWWKWDEHQADCRPNYYTDPNGDQGFTILGKPAAATLSRAFSDLRNG